MHRAPRLRQIGAGLRHNLLRLGDDRNLLQHAQGILLTALLCDLPIDDAVDRNPRPLNPHQNSTTPGAAHLPPLLRAHRRPV